ncbi:MAG: hypothetical protein QM734_06710 [Cyclobacteriaceae bacterium]
MKIKKYSLIIFVLVLAFGCETTSNLRSPNKDYFIKYYGGDGNQYAVDMIANSDGTFYILGNSVPAQGQNQQVYLAKVDAQGNMIGNAVTVSSNGSLEAKDFEVLGDSIVVVGNETFSSNRHRIFLARFSSSDLSSYKTSSYLLLDDTTRNVFANSLTSLTDGGYAIAGYIQTSSGTDALFMRLSSSLVQKQLNSNPPWQSTSHPGTVSSIEKVFVSPTTATDSSLLYSFGATDARASDENFWTSNISVHGVPGPSSDDLTLNEFVINGSNEIVTKVIHVSPGGYLMTGVSISSSQNMSIIAKKLKQDVLTFNDDVKYTYLSGSLGKPASQMAQYATVCQNNSLSGFFILSNTYNTTSGASDIYLQKLDLLLQDAWRDPVTFGGDGEDTAAAVAELPDGHIMVLGTMNIGDKPEQFKIVLLKLNAAGKLAN